MKPYRILFSLAAFYNLAFGVWAGFFPLHFFRVFDLPPPQYPSIWACVGMVVGIYCLAYAYVAWKPEEGDVLILIGLIGKVLGPLGWLHAVNRGEFPARTFPLTLFNDLIWWFPFLFYLLRKQRLRGRVISLIVVFMHAVACLGLLLLQGGMEFNPSLPARRQWVADHTSLWTFVWFFWVLSSLSIPAFMTSWALALREQRKTPSWVWIGPAICAFGVLFDVSAELIYIAWLPEVSRSLADFERGVRAYNVLSAGVANGLYCVAGLFLSTVSLRGSFLRGFQASLGFLMWGAGLSLTVMALLNNRLGIMVTAATTMALFIPWAAWVGWKFVREKA